MFVIELHTPEGRELIPAYSSAEAKSRAAYEERLAEAMYGNAERHNISARVWRWED